MFGKRKKPSRWAPFNDIPGAIGEFVKAPKSSSPKVKNPEDTLQGKAEELCQELGIRFFRIPKFLVTWLMTNTHTPRVIKGFVAKYFKGFPDLAIFKKSPSGDNIARFIEIKTEVGNPTQGQTIWHRGLNVIVAHGWHETEKAIRSFAA